MILCYTVPEIWRVTDVIFFFELFFALLPPSLPHLTARKVKKIFEKEKISLHFCIKNYDQMMYGS